VTAASTTETAGTNSANGKSTAGTAGVTPTSPLQNQPAHEPCLERLEPTASITEAAHTHTGAILRAAETNPIPILQAPSKHATGSPSIPPNRRNRDDTEPLDSSRRGKRPDDKDAGNSRDVELSSAIIPPSGGDAGQRPYTILLDCSLNATTCISQDMFERGLAVEDDTVRTHMWERRKCLALGLSDTLYIAETAEHQLPYTILAIMDLFASDGCHFKHDSSDAGDWALTSKQGGGFSIRPATAAEVSEGDEFAHLGCIDITYDPVPRSRHTLCSSPCYFPLPAWYSWYNTSSAGLQPCDPWDTRTRERLHDFNIKGAVYFNQLENRGWATKNVLLRVLTPSDRPPTVPGRTIRVPGPPAGDSPPLAGPADPAPRGRSSNSGGNSTHSGGTAQQRGNYEQPRGGSAAHSGSYDRPRGGSAPHMEGHYDQPRGGPAQYMGGNKDKPRGGSAQYMGGNVDQPRGGPPHRTGGGYDQPRGGFPQYSGRAQTWKNCKGCGTPVEWVSHHSWVVHNRECTANQNRGWGRNDARNPRDQEGRGSGGNARGDARSQEGRGHSRNARDPNSGEGRRRSRERSGGRRSTSQRSTSQERKIDQEIQWRTQNRDGADPRYPASRGPEQDARPWNRGPDLRHGQTPLSRSGTS